MLPGRLRGRRLLSLVVPRSIPTAFAMDTSSLEQARHQEELQPWFLVKGLPGPSCGSLGAHHSKLDRGPIKKVGLHSPLRARRRRALGSGACPLLYWPVTARASGTSRNHLEGTVGRRPFPHRRGRGTPGRPSPGQRRPAARRRLYVCAHPRHPHPQYPPRGDGTALGARAPALAPQRAPLRGVDGPGQGGNTQPVRRRAVPAVASQLRRAAGPAGARLVL